MYQNIRIEKREYVYIKRMLNIQEFTADASIHMLVQQWQKKLAKATIVDEEYLPKDVIRCFSKVQVQLTSGTIQQLQIVLPMEANTITGKFSIISPIAIALLGHTKGDCISVSNKAKEEWYTIVDVVQDVAQQCITAFM